VSSRETGNLSIATSRYQAHALIIESGLAPVRTTLYHPRFPLRYELAGKLDALAPRRSIFRLEGVEFERAYRRQLDHQRMNPIPGLRFQMAAIAKKADAPGVVLLCFEDVLAGEECHRRIFASWWWEQTGQRIPELGEES
jgi:hypothetical protein